MNFFDLESYINVHVSNEHYIFNETSFKKMGIWNLIIQKFPEVSLSE